MYEIPEEIMKLYEIYKPYIKNGGDGLIKEAPDFTIDAFNEAKKWAFAQAQ